jgi:S-formylglutathione hydrolase FrmB
MASGAGLFQPDKPHASQCVRARNYEAYIAKDLVGWVDAHYRTIQRRDGRAIAGLSMGGFGAMSIGLRHPDEFAAEASHSGAIALMFRGPRPFDPARPVELITRVEPASDPIVAWIGAVFGSDLADWKAHDVVELATALPPGKLALYFDCGTEDGFHLQDNVQYVHAALTARHIDHAFYVGPGHHDFAFWAQRVPSSLAFLRDHTAKPE